MPDLIVVDEPSDWPATLSGAQVIAAGDYLTEPQWFVRRGMRIYNLCKSYRYQHYGYYVSLLAAARGHRPLPDVATMQDLKNRSMLRLLTEDLDALMQKSLREIESDEFVLSIYFGENMAQRHEKLARGLFNLVPAPLLRAKFRRRQEQWQLNSLRAISMGEISESHQQFLVQAIEKHFSRRERTRRRDTPSGYDLGILADEHEASPPSDGPALRKIVRAAKQAGFNVEFLSADDYGRIAEFDALLIRETTSVTHHTYRFARRAEVEGLVVIDSPLCIIRCTNKVYLAELMQRHNIRVPDTMIVNHKNQHTVAETIGFPVILKRPDSSFSVGVSKADNEAQLTEKLQEMFRYSDLVVAQAFLPTDFDWRIGVLDGKPLFACRYYMVSKHWQIYKREGGRVSSGNFDTLAIEDAPPKVVNTALRAANAIGRGLYGVDLKEINGKVYVVEVNDNPSIDSGVEDKILGMALYERLMAVFLERVEARKRSDQSG